MATVGAIAALSALPIPAASAEPCTVTVTVAGGQALTFNVSASARVHVDPHTGSPR